MRDDCWLVKSNKIWLKYRLDAIYLQNVNSRELQDLHSHSAFTLADKFVVSVAAVELGRQIL